MQFWRYILNFAIWNFHPFLFYKRKMTGWPYFWYRKIEIPQAYSKWLYVYFTSTDGPIEQFEVLDLLSATIHLLGWIVSVGKWNDGTKIVQKCSLHSTIIDATLKTF